MPALASTAALIVQGLLLLVFTVWGIKAWPKDHIITFTLGVVNLFLLAAILGNLDAFQMLLTLVSHHV